MRNKRHLIFVIVLFFCFCSSFAYSLGSSDWTTVAEIIQGPGSNPLIRLTDPKDASTGCPGSSAGYISIKEVDSSEVGKRHFTTILSALMSQKEVNITTNECNGEYPYIQYIKVRK